VRAIDEARDALERAKTDLQTAEKAAKVAEREREDAVKRAEAARKQLEAARERADSAAEAISRTEPALFLAGRRRRPELVRELLDDPVAQRIGHLEDVVVDGVERANVVVPFLVQPRDNLAGRRRQVRLHHVDQRGARPVRVRLAQEVGDLVGVVLPRLSACC
jgi:hypothetical protein